MKIVLGAIISMPPFAAGCAWNRLQYFIGLLRLGHDVCFVEEVKPKWSINSLGQRCAYRDSINRSGFKQVMERFDLMDRSCQLFDGGAETTGMSREELLAFAQDADLLIDISGHVTTEWLLDAVDRRAYFDHDPVYTQLWRAEYGKDLNLDRYDVFLTLGLNIGTPFSHIPDCGITWHASLPPVVMDLWETDHGAPHVTADSPFTTVASLSGYGDLSYKGEWYRTKYDEFRRFAEIPRRANAKFEVLLKDFSDDDEGVRLLRANGWQVRKSAQAVEAVDLFAYRDYIARSRGEIGISKGAYVKGRSGWFSDRSSSYLATGKPCLVQSTGFERHLPTGMGVIPFDSIEEVVAGVDAINSDYAAHCRAAREWAAAYLDHRKVLPGLVDSCMISAEPVGEVQ